MGNWAGYLNSTGSRNVIVGIAGYENTTGNSNVFVGTFAGTKNHEGYGNVFIGDYAGAKTSGGMLNAFLGKNAGGNSLWGAKNVFIGNNAGREASGAEESIIIGTNAGLNATGIQNVILGTNAGYSNSDGRNNVFIGYSAGYYETGSDKLYISNNDTDSPLIWGDFVEGLVVIGGNISSNPNHRALFVCGPAGGVTAWYNDSDRNLKHDITTIPDALDKIMKLRGVNFKWNDPKPGMENLQMGFIGQEAEAVIPEVVSSSNNHYSMQYAPITALLVEGMKAQEKKIEDQQKEIDELKSLVKSLTEE